MTIKIKYVESVSVQDAIADAVHDDCDRGVRWSTDNAHARFRDDYPEVSTLLDMISEQHGHLPLILNTGEHSE